MTHVQVLPPALANLIAAGEVVERPASIVKELIENAIDAAATEIRVDITSASGGDGGTGGIAVTDDGIGMTRDDAELALRRHATSKIQSIADLAAIRTLGFRGEALPSIAAATRLTLTTQARGMGHGPGTRIRVAGGIVEAIEEVGAPEGTTVAVHDLFYNIPARRKFLKGERTEFGHIQETVQRFALAYPAIRFRLIHDGRLILAAHAVGDPRVRVLELFGAEVAEHLSPVDEGSGDLRLHGFCGAPTLARPGATRLHSFVNGRPVRDRVLLHAITEGYRTYVPKGEQPFAVLFLTMDPDRVDVNVHPAKAEVRFANPGAVHQFVANAVRKRLAQVSTWIPSQETPPPYPSPARGGDDVQWTSEAPGADDKHAGGASELAGGGERPYAGSLVVQEAMTLYQSPSGYASFDSSDGLAQDRPTHLRTEVFRPLGQLAGTYLLYEGAGGTLVLVDQHAAHERIGYEQLKRQLTEGGVAQQTLLVPVIIELKPTEAAAVAEAQDALHRLGLDIAPFGGNSVAVTAVPTLLHDVDVAGLVTAVAGELVAQGSTTELAGRLDHVLATMACHRQIRAGDRLEPEDLSALIGQLADGVSKERCPHGRPTWIALSQREIEKWFKRT